MDQIYIKIWELARPYYEKGRSYDIFHIEWMMREAERVADIEKLQKKLLLPIVILHDVGYSVFSGDNPHIKNKESKIIHMREGARIAKNILQSVDFDPEFIERIVYYISVHDNWVLGDDKPYQESKEMAVFNDLDFLWAQSNFEVFKFVGKSMGLSLEETYDFWLKDEKLVRRPFSCNETKRLFEEFMKYRKKEIGRQE